LGKFRKGLRNPVAGTRLLGTLRPPIEDLEHIWLFTYSRASFLQTVEFLDSMDAVKPDSVELRALIDAAFVAYARPFSRCRVPSRGSIDSPLKGVSPPAQLAEFHNEALIARNTMVGHKDATPAEEYTATPNVVLIDIFANTFAVNCVMPAEMTDRMKHALRELCNYFVKHCEEDLSLWKKSYGCEVMKKLPGKYELVISDPPCDWIIPFRIKHGVDFKAQ
jgi:hypothetical protein